MANPNKICHSWGIWLVSTLLVRLSDYPSKEYWRLDILSIATTQPTKQCKTTWLVWYCYRLKKKLQKYRYNAIAKLSKVAIIWSSNCLNYTLYIRIYPKISKYILIYPNISKYIQMYPNISKYIQIYLNLTKYNQIYPPNIPISPYIS